MRRKDKSMSEQEKALLEAVVARLLRDAETERRTSAAGDYWRGRAEGIAVGMIAAAERIKANLLPEPPPDA
jgi:histone H3/H4